MKNDVPVTAPLAAFWERKPRKPWENTSSPKIASTTLGTPAIISIADSTARASRECCPYSVSHAASAIPTGAAIAMPIAVTRNVPTIGSRKPPAWLCCSDGAGDCTNRLGRR